MVYFIYIYIALYIYLSFIQVHELCQKKKMFLRLVSTLRIKILIYITSGVSY